MNRREFLETAAATACFTIVPRQVLGGPGVVPPSDKITLAHIGCGTEGLSEMTGLIANPELQIVAVCDPSKHSVGYRDWSKDGLLNRLRKTVGKTDWRAGTEGEIPGGRDLAKDFVETYYANQRPGGTFKGCAAWPVARCWARSTGPRPAQTRSDSAAASPSASATAPS